MTEEAAVYQRRAGPMPRLTDRLELGDGLRVSPFCLGLVGEPGTVTAAYEAGINFFFITADMHWPLYEGLRRGLRDLLRARPAVRDDLVVASVSYATQPEFCWYPHQELLDEVPELQRLDVTIAGGAYRRELKTRREVYRLHKVRRHLGVRAVGVTLHDRLAAVEAPNRKAFDIVFVRYNPDHTGAQREVFPKLVRRQKSLLYNFKSTVGYVSPERASQLGVDDGFWRPHITDYYRFALTPAAMSGILCGLTKPSQVRDLADAMAKGPLDEEEEQFLVDLRELDAGRAELNAAEGDSQGGGQ